MHSNGNMTGVPGNNDNFEGLNQQQQEAASFEGRNLLVLAGAGTGKTRTIIARAKYLLDHGVLPSRILILSFTRKSAKEIVDRLKCSVKKDAGQLKGQTFHSWCMELIESNPAIFNFGKFSVIDEDDCNSAFRLIAGREFKKHNYIKPEVLADVYSFAVNSRCNLSTAIRKVVFNGSTDTETQENILKRLPIFKEIITKYMAFKAERHYLDYDDILQKVALGLKRNPEAAQYISAGYDHILVDEMQDTNPLQYLLLSSFWDRCNLFCVGDDAQSIYGFRGADFQSIHRFTEVVPDAQVKKLTVNYRSTQEILDLSNWLLSQSPLNYDKDLEAHRGKGEKPSIVHFHQEWDEARDIVMRIKNAQGEEGARFSDNMILSRGAYGMRTVEACLIEAQIPYKVFGGTGLMASAHIRDVVSALRIVANPQDELAWTRYLRLFPRIGDITAARIVGKVLGLPSLDECVAALQDFPTLSVVAGQTLLTIAEAQTQVNEAITAAFKGLATILAAIYKDDWEKRALDFPLLAKIGIGADSIATFLSEFVLDPSLGTGVKQEDGEDDCVTLTTIHSAKGLEAKNCYIVNVSYSSYPSPKAVASGDDAVEEDRRCLYVAMTRAKDRLVMYRSARAVQVSGDTGDAVNGKYFLNNLPPYLFNPEWLNDRSRDWQNYKGSGITLDDCTDFDFS